MSSIFSAESRVQRVLDFEGALARAEARAGIIPPAAAAAISEKCKVEMFDLSRLSDEETTAGTLAIPVVRMLTQLVDDHARGFVHWGATSQDAMDTGMVLQMRDGLDAMIDDLVGVGSSCSALAERHRWTLMAGRTLLQHALPITFGLKAAHWLSVTTRHVRRLRDLRSGALVVQFGGAAGTLGALGGEGVRVADLVAEELGLRVPDLPWHTDRDQVAEIATALGIVAGAMAKIAMDVALLMQTEVGEVREAPAEGKGTSSTMPQKRNPVDAPAAIASARLAFGAVAVVLGAIVQEHERAVGGWQAEWVAVPDVFRFTAGAVARVRAIVGSVEVHPERMKANLDTDGGQIMAEALVMALAPTIGRHEAYALVAAVSRRAEHERVGLRHAAEQDPRVTEVLPPQALDPIFDPLRYLGSTDVFIQRALDDFTEVWNSTAGTR